tara:strand:+ start:63498 stop:64706 length:1209 start_codon:yes stop_codon:yes gene_type:complete
MKNILIDKSIKLLPNEEMLEVKQNFKSLSVGIPKESSLQEKRVALTPESVELLVNSGHKVYVEKDAGNFSNFYNEEYIKYGAVITDKRDEIYSCDFVLKIEPPTVSEINFLSEKNVIISALQLNIHKKSFFDSINKKNITAVSFEYLQDNEGKNSIVRSMSEIAGNTSVLIASECLSNINGGKGILLGGISGVISTNVVILGAGTVAEFAARSAAGLGANITIFDNSITKLKRLQNNLNTRVNTSSYTSRSLMKSLMRADVVIGASSSHNYKKYGIYVSSDMVKMMKKGSVIVDVSIDQGGCFETSKITNHKSPTFEKFGVIHYCVPNIPSRVSRTASISISQVLTNLLITIGKSGGVTNYMKNNKGFRCGVFSYNGFTTNKYISEKFGLIYKDLGLIMPSF